MFPVLLQDVGSTEQLLGSPLPSHPLLQFILTERNAIPHWHGWTTNTSRENCSSTLHKRHKSAKFHIMVTNCTTHLVVHFALQKQEKATFVKQFSIT